MLLATQSHACLIEHVLGHALQVEKLDHIEPGRVAVTVRDAAQRSIVQAAARAGSLQLLGVTVTL